LTDEDRPEPDFPEPQAEPPLPDGYTVLSESARIEAQPRPKGALSPDDPRLGNTFAVDGTRRPENALLGDWHAPMKRLNWKHKQFALMVAAGKNGTEIQRVLGYTPETSSKLRNTAMVIEEIQRLQDRMFSKDIDAGIKSFGPDALAVIEKVLTDETDNEITISHKADMAKWVAEKVTGKAQQKVTVQGDIVTSIYAQVDQMKASGQIINVGSSRVPQARGDLLEGQEPPRDVHDLEKTEEVSSLEDWVFSHVPDNTQQREGKDAAQEDTKKNEQKSETNVTEAKD